MKNSDLDSSDYEASAFLSVTGPDIDPDHLSKILGLTPSSTSNTSSRPRTDSNKERNFWIFKTDSSREIKLRPIEAVIKSIIDAPEIDLSKFSAVPRGSLLTIVVTVYSDTRPTFALPSELMQRLGKSGIDIELVVYAGDDLLVE